VDPTYPARRITFMAADSGLTLLVADPGADTVLPDIPTLALTESLWSSGQPTLDLFQLTRTARLTVIYTSGSTGRPKGVEISHRSVVALLDACDLVFDLRPTTCGRCFTPTASTSECGRCGVRSRTEPR